MERSKEVWLFDTNSPTNPANRFKGPLIVTMSLTDPPQVIIATKLTSRYIYTHGAPVHIGDPEVLGIDLPEPLTALARISGPTSSAFRLP